MSQANPSEQTPASDGDQDVPSLTGRRGEQEEEEEIWVPLSMNVDDDDLNDVTDDQYRYTGGTHPPSASTRSQGSVPGRSSGSNSLQRIQRRLETKISIQNNLVNHPIDLFWKRFLVNLLLELWTLEVRIRFGLVLLVLGLLTRLFVWTFWYMLYPRVALLSSVFLVSVVYLDPFEIQNQVRAVGEILLNPEKAIQAIERLNLEHIRRLAVVLFMFPTLLEVRTLLFLSQVSAETGWMTYNAGIGSLLLGTMLFLYKYRGMKPRDSTYRGMLIAYGSALLISIYRFSIRRMPFLAAPFLTATGTLLLTYQDDDMEWMSRVVRHALRVSLRDVLSSVGSRVTEDEMLQLAILRWISDFWANNPEAPSAASSSSSTAGTQPESSQQSSSESAQMGHRAASSSSDNSVAVSRPSADQGPSVPSSLPQRDVQWEELLPMLNIEIDHMEVEAETLQSNIPNQGSTLRTNATSQQQDNRKQSSNLDAFDDLKAMLLSLNVDERAKPAVESYRRAVESFPPQKSSSVLLSVVRRCPALLALVFQVLFGQVEYMLSTFMILVPFVVLEYFRILQWIVSCQQVVNIAGEVVDSTHDNDWTVPNGLKNVDTMTILLCGDNHSNLRPPTLLRVWHNIVSSVSALEVGLTAARCAETTAVAADFAGNVMSLVQFGFEVAEHGLLHGLGVVVREAISVGGDFSNLDRMNDGSVRYIRAAVQAVQSGHRVARNIQALSEDEHVGAFVQPVAVAFGALIGHGWLWGKDGTTNSDGSSRVVIEEIPEGLGTENEVFQSETTEDGNLKEAADSGPVKSPVRASPTTAADGDDNNDSSVQSHGVRIAHSNSDESILSKLSPTGELAEVMEMVAIAYERGLIEDAEKADFYEKLSRFKEEELSNPSILSSMKRTLNIILENGCEMCLVEATPDVVAKECHENLIDSNPRDATQESTESLAREESDSAQRDETEIPASASTDEVGNQDFRVDDSTIAGNTNDALIKFGAAALGVIAGGVLLSMAGHGQEDTQSNRREQTHEEEERGHTERNQSSTVVIEELSEDDDEWVSVPQ